MCYSQHLAHAHRARLGLAAAHAFFRNVLLSIPINSNGTTYSHTKMPAGFRPSSVSLWLNALDRAYARGPIGR